MAFVLEGGGVTIGNKQSGHLLLMKGEKGSDKKRYQTYRDNALLPFINKTRSEFGEWVEGSPIPEDLRAISWCDGDLAQIENVVSDESLQIYSMNMICANKQNAARSGVEQAADLTKTFKIMHKLQSEITVSHVPIKNHPLKNDPPTTQGPCICWQAYPQADKKEYTH